MSDKPKFDDCLEVLETKEVETNDLSDFLGDDGVSADDWRQHWKEMPEFEQEEQKPFKEIKVCFQTEEDFLEFKKLLNQPMTKKTKTIWYPEYNRDKNSLYAWFEE